MRSKRSKAWHVRKDIQRARAIIEQGTGPQAITLQQLKYVSAKFMTRAVVLNEAWMVKIEAEDKPV